MKSYTTQTFILNILITFSVIITMSTSTHAHDSREIDLITNNVDKLPKPIPHDYSGFSVQILETDKELTQQHSIFKQFGDIKIQRTDGIVYYLVGDFKTLEAAQNYVDKVVNSRFPSAIVARYENGIRIDLDE